MPEIQERRENKRVPGGHMLHEYANMYFDAHNPMLSKCRIRNNEICVLRLDHRVLDMEGVIITDRNASSGWASFWPIETGIELLNRDRLFARYWTHDDPYEQMNHKSEKCAEILVPDRVPAQFVRGAYVANKIALNSFQGLNTRLPVQPHGMFF